MAFQHGVYVQERETSLLATANIESAAIFCVGTAPVHRASAPAALNELKLVLTADEANRYFGFDSSRPADQKYSLCQQFYASFAMFGTGPIMAVNVFDPYNKPSHRATALSVPVTLEGNAGELPDDCIIVAEGVNFTLTDASGDVTYELVREDEDGFETGDYYLDTVHGTVTRRAGGQIPVNAELRASYTYGEPSLVTDNEIIGAVIEGEASGLQVIDQCFTRFQIVPGFVTSPGHSTSSTVASMLAGKASNINTLFRGHAISDVPVSGPNAVKVYSEVTEYKNKNNLVDVDLTVCWPKCRFGDWDIFKSAEAAALCGQVDGNNEGVPCESPSNKNLKMDSAIVGEGDSAEEVWLTLEQANYLNANGIVTSINFYGGWKLWGNRTSAYPANTDPKDMWISVRRMMNWWATKQILTIWQKVDKPGNRRQIETIIDTLNWELNGLQARGYILGGECSFNESDNPATDLIDGVYRFHNRLGFLIPMEQIIFINEYDPQYLSLLFE